MTSRILVVDDSATVRTLHTYILSAEGFDTVEADSGFAALEALHQQPCDLAVIDMNMPRMDGREVLRVIKSDPRLKDIPVVILTTSKEQRDIEFCASAGACNFITKPVEFEEWVTIITALADTH